MHDLFKALLHLLWHSTTGLVGGWMGTTILALAVGLLINQVGPRLDAWYRGEKFVGKPRRIGTLLVTIGTWIVLFSASLVSTIYRDHANLVSENQSLAGQFLSQGQQLKQNQTTISDLKDELAAFQVPESQDSLRKRTLRLADEMSAHLSARENNHPPRAYPDSRDPNPTPERQKAIEISQQYDQETLDYWMKHFKDRVIGIIREYNARGVRTGFLESAAGQRVFMMAPPGQQGDQIYEMEEFRDLAYHVDAHDRLITF